MHKHTQVNVHLTLNHPFPYDDSSDPFTGKVSGRWLRWKQIQIHTHTLTQTTSPLHPLLIQCIHMSSILLHDFISLCGCVAPMCFWQLYGGLAGPHSLSGSVNWVFSAVFSPPAWWRRRPENACSRPWTKQRDTRKHQWVNKITSQVDEEKIFNFMPFKYKV